MFVREGHAKVGAEVVTQPMGEWPGGVATIVKHDPDPAAPEIVMTVRMEGHGTIGVFEYEQVYPL